MCRPNIDVYHTNDELKIEKFLRTNYFKRYKLARKWNVFLG